MNNLKQIAVDLEYAYGVMSYNVCKKETKAWASKVVIGT